MVKKLKRLIMGRDEVKIWLQYPENDRNSLEDVNKLKIKTTNGSTYSLEELVDYEFKRGRVKINHINGAKRNKGKCKSI